jgi:bifunctional non-homologous end joining protein LigD
MIVPVCAYEFALMRLQGRDLRDEPLVKRRTRLKRLLARGKGNLLRFSDSFPDAVVLLAECIRLGLEGIVCKRKDARYRSGARCGWVKIKTEQWKAANRYRAKLFEKGNRA